MIDGPAGTKEPANGKAKESSPDVKYEISPASTAAVGWRYKLHLLAKLTEKIFAR